MFIFRAPIVTQGLPVRCFLSKKYRMYSVDEGVDILDLAALHLASCQVQVLRLIPLLYVFPKGSKTKRNCKK